jgi:hypothetical protein
MQFSIWLEARDFEEVKNTILTSLFPTLDKQQQKDNIGLPLDTLDDDLINQMLDNGNIRDRLQNRNPHQFLKSKKGITVGQFIDWLINAQSV